MKLDRVTITGADNSIAAADLAALSNDFPFVEWGILCSKTQMGGTRFPDRKWLDQLEKVYLYTAGMNLSCHLCGRWVRDFLKEGDHKFTNEIGSTLFHAFQRVQLNFHGQPHQLDLEKFCNGIDLLEKYGPTRQPKQWIFQFDRVNDDFLKSVLDRKIDGVPLFDTSGGIGQLPDSWPLPIGRKKAVGGDENGPDCENPGDPPLCVGCHPTCASYVEPLYCGYAGGLGPDSLEEQLPKIAEAASEARIWIDMETRVRSDDDQQFDLKKVRRCLEITDPFVKG